MAAFRARSVERGRTGLGFCCVVAICAVEVGSTSGVDVGVGVGVGAGCLEGGRVSWTLGRASSGDAIGVVVVCPAISSLLVLRVLLAVGSE